MEKKTIYIKYLETQNTRAPKTGVERVDAWTPCGTMIAIWRSCAKRNFKSYIRYEYVEATKYDYEIK
jgi:hypothetical protein